MSAHEGIAQRWGKLSPRTRWLLASSAAAETGLKVAVLLDLRRRPASQIRGPKWLWAGSMIVNSAGLIPISYFVFGRRSAAEAAASQP
jgi:hypothetical protein